MLGACGSAVAAGIPVDELVVRFHDDNALAASASLSPAALAELNAALGLTTRSAGRTADGAHRLLLDAPIDAEVARDALNRIRSTGAVLYADAAMPSSTAVNDSLPVHRLIVKFRAGAAAAVAMPSATRSRLESAAGQRVRVDHRGSGATTVVGLERGVGLRSANAIAQSLANDPDVEYAEPERRALPQAMTPDDPMFAQQWSLTDPVGGIDVAGAWNVTTGSAGVTVAILDTGKLPHPDLVSRYVGGYDFVSDPRFSNDGDGRDADPGDPGDWLPQSEIDKPGSPYAGCTATGSTWHGTQVAGIVAASANNGAGIAGINWQSPIVPVRVMGRCGAGVADLADGIRWAAGLSVPGAPANDHPARVLNLSMSGDGPCGPTLQSAVDDAIAAGAVIVAAAGNQGDDVANHFPANCHGVIAVAGSERAGSRMSYSNFGAGIALAAPSGGSGGNIMTTRNDGNTTPNPAGYGYAMNVGTSFSAPHVVGAVSLLLSADPTLDAAQVLAILQQSARTPPADVVSACTAATCGSGLLDAGLAVARIAAGAPGGGNAPPAPAPQPGEPPGAAPPSGTPAGTSVAERTEFRNEKAPTERERPRL